MTGVEIEVVEQVRIFAGDDSPTAPSGDLTDSLLALDRDNLTGKSAIRYLMRIGKWRFESNGGFHDAMQHLFGHFEGCQTVEPEVYQAQSTTLIKDLWNYDYVMPIPAPAVEKTPAAKKKPVRSRKAYTIPDDEVTGSSEEGVSGSKKFKSINEQNAIDTTGASDRLKKVINIQRGG